MTTKQKFEAVAELLRKFRDVTVNLNTFNCRDYNDAEDIIVIFERLARTRINESRMA